MWYDTYLIKSALAASYPNHRVPSVAQRQPSEKQVKLDEKEPPGHAFSVPMLVGEGVEGILKILARVHPPA